MEKALGCKNLAGNKTQYYSNEFKKRRWEIQDYEDYQPCRKFIAEELAIHLILDTITVKAGELKIKLAFNQLDSIMTKQQSIYLRLRKLFPNEEIIEDFSALNYLIDYYFPKCKLAIEVDELGHKDRDQTKENKRQKDLKEYLDCEFNRINPDEKDFSAYDELGKVQTFIDKSKEKEIKEHKKEIKEHKKEIKEQKEEIKEYKEEIKELEDKIKELEDKNKKLNN